MHTKKGQMELPAGLVPPGPAHGSTISHAPGFGTLGGGRAPFGRTQVPSSRPYGHRPTSAQHRKLQAFGHQIPDSFTAISESQYRDLLSHSLRVDEHDHQASPSAGQMVRQKVIKHVEVPVIHEHTVPVERDVVSRTTRKQKTAYEISACLVGSEMCIRDRDIVLPWAGPGGTRPAGNSIWPFLVCMLVLSLIHI